MMEMFQCNQPATWWLAASPVNYQYTKSSALVSAVHKQSPQQYQ